MIFDGMLSFAKRAEEPELKATQLQKSSKLTQQNWSMKILLQLYRRLDIVQRTVKMTYLKPLAKEPETVHVLYTEIRSDVIGNSWNTESSSGFPMEMIVWNGDNSLSFTRKWMKVLVDSQRLTCTESSREGTRCTVGFCEGQLKTCLSNIMADSEKASEKNSILEVKKHLHF